MEAVLWTAGLIFSWNIGLTFWLLKQRRNGRNNNPGHNPGQIMPMLCEERRVSIGKLENKIEDLVKARNGSMDEIKGQIESARKEANDAQRRLRNDLSNMQQTVAVLWHDAHPGVSMPKRV